MSFIARVSTRIQIASPKWIVPNVFAALRKALGSKRAVKIWNKKGRTKRSLSIIDPDCTLYVFTTICYETCVYIISKRIGKHLYVPRRAYIAKNIYNA